MLSVLAPNCDWIYSFLLGWAVTIVSGISAYPLDTLKRRMMMTAGQSRELRYCGVTRYLLYIL